MIDKKGRSPCCLLEISWAEHRVEYVFDAPPTLANIMEQLCYLEDLGLAIVPSVALRLAGDGGRVVRPGMTHYFSSEDNFPYDLTISCREVWVALPTQHLNSICRVL